MTITANGRTWLKATRLRHSTRRSLPATSRAVRSRRRLTAPAAHREPKTVLTRWPADDDVDAAGRQRSGPLELVAGDDTVAPDEAAWRSVTSSSSRPAASSPAWGSSSSHSWARRATRHARAVRRCWPADRRRTGRSARRPDTSRRSIAAATSASLAPTVAPQKRTFSAHGEVEVQPVAMAEQPDAAAHRGAVACRGRTRARRRGRGPAGPARRRRAAASSCRRRSGRGAARSRRGRRGGSRRRAPGTSRARRRRRPARRRSPAVDPSPGDATGTVTPRDGNRRRRRRARRDAPVGDRGVAPPRAAPGRQAQHPLGPAAPAPRLAVGRRHARQGAHRDRAADVRLRRLPAVGHRARVRPGPEPPRRRVRAPRSPPRRRRRRHLRRPSRRPRRRSRRRPRRRRRPRPRFRRRRRCRPSPPAT